MGRPLIEMVGKKFGCSEVVCESDKSTAKRKLYVTQCLVCGNKREMFGENIRRAIRDGSSGCSCAEKKIKNRLSDKGEWSHPLYKTWDGMMRRCYKKNNPQFKNYGARGITVCDDWHDATKFFIWADQNHESVRGLQIDRIDNDKGYSPENCRFITQMENANNKRNNRRIFVFGKSMTVAQASREFGVKYTTIRARLDSGWEEEKAVMEK